MDPMPWRFIVLTEAGAEESAPGLAVKGEDWLAALDSSAFDPVSIAKRPGPPDLDAVLHEPGLERLESAWRGLRFLLEHAAASAEIEVLSVSRRELVSRFREVIFTPEMESASNSPVSLVLADFDFTHRSDDLAILREMGGMLKAMQCPMVAAVSPGFFEMRYTSQVMSLPDIAGRILDPAHAAWRTFQASEEARWIALTVNRYLQRAPYDMERLGYKEAADDSKPDSYLWGRGMWLVGAAAARSIRTFGHGLDLSGRGGMFEGLATRPYAVAANEKVPLATEVPLPEEKAQEFSRAGFTPVVGRIRSNVAVLPIVVTLFRLRPGTLTVEGTLAYQLLAGRLAQFCTALLGEIPGEGEEKATAFIKSELTGFLGPLAGESPEGAVTVDLVGEEVEGVQRLYANVLVRPAVPLEGKSIEFGFRLPLRTG